MKLGVVVSTDPWRFFTDVFAAFRANHEVSVFNPRTVKAPFFYTRINRYVFQRDLANFLSRQDLVFFEWASDLLVAATRLPKMTKIVVRLHRYEIYRWAAEVNWDRVDQVILVSQAMREKFARRFPDHAHKTAVIPVGISLDKFTPVSKPYQGDLGTLCFLSPRKRVYELVLAFAELSKPRNGYRLHIGGGGDKFEDYTEALSSLVKKLGIEEHVVFHGRIDEPWTWYRSIDIYISNSYSEGLQVAPMEAMASGRYCLSHHWDGAEELVPPDHLYLTDAELLEKIRAYSGMSAEEQHQVQQEMRRLACEKFDAGLINAQILRLVEKTAQS